MRERAKGLIGRDAKRVVVCTFHALGVRMMREDGAVLGLKPAFSILDSDDVTKILKDAGGTTDAATARIWQWTISKWKNMGLNAAQAEAQAADDNERIGFFVQLQAPIAVGTAKEVPGNRVADGFLDGVAHWPGTELGVKSFPHQERQYRVVHSEIVTLSAEEGDLLSQKLFRDFQLMFVLDSGRFMPLWPVE